MLTPEPQCIVGSSLLPKVHQWVRMLLGLPARRHDVEPSPDELMIELLQLRSQHERLKRNPRELELDGNMVRIAKRCKRITHKDQVGRDRENLMCALHASGFSFLTF